jgi:hypothetical protein
LDGFGSFHVVDAILARSAVAANSWTIRHVP